MKISPRAFVTVAWIQSIVATLGSLYFSEIRHLVPCVLCWYQRIVLYPLVILLAVALWRREENIIGYYVLPLSVIGIGISGFHYLLQRGVIPASAGPCIAGVSCTTRYIEYFGFVTIPFMALVAFTVITVCLASVVRNERRRRDHGK